MFEVRWESSYPIKENKKHGIFNTEDEAYQSIKDWWKKNDYKPNYVRLWRTHGKLHIDYGSHHSFYTIVDLDKE